MSTYMQTLLETPLLSRIRRNHGLEHATVHILAKRFPGLNIAGHSDTGGFWILGNVPTEEVTEAVTQAHSRLRAGEIKLAVHPGCGTSRVTAGALAGAGSMVALAGVGRRWRDKLERFPLVVLLATLGMIVAEPLGLLIQKRVTTSGHLGNLEIVEVVPHRRRRVMAHRITTRG